METANKVNPNRQKVRVEKASEPKKIGGIDRNQYTQNTLPKMGLLLKKSFVR